MIRDLLTAFAIIVIAILVYRYQHRIAAALRRFDERNVRRIQEQEQERADPLAHFKHTLKTAEEQVEAVSEITVSDERLGTPVTRFLFEGRQYASRHEADIARAEKIRTIARKYYLELPAALAERKEQSTIRETTPKDSPPPSSPPPQAPSNVVPLRRGDETLH